MRFFSLLLVLAIVLSPTVQAVIFWYDDEVDQQNAVEYANRYPYDSIEPDDFNDFRDYNCFDLDAYNSFAGSHDYDRYEQLTADNMRTSDLQRLRRDDYNTIANQNAHDSIRPDDVDGYGDTACWTLGDYNRFADTERRDKWDSVRFQDFDDLETVNKIGTQRFHFFEPDDAAYFDLQRTEPRHFSLPRDDPYHYQNYQYYKPSYRARYYAPYGSVDFRTVEYQ